MKNKGNIIISVLFVIFLTFVGLTLLNFSVLHTKSVRARTMRLVENDKIYQNLIFYLHHFREKIFNERIRDFNHPAEDYFNATCFPDREIDRDHFITHDFDYFEVPKENYTRTRVTAAIDASSTAVGETKYRLSSEVFIDILSGQIPLTLFPLFVNKTGDNPPVPADVDTFLQENNIRDRSGKNVVVDDVEVELGNAEFLLDALKISGDILGWREIREKFGLPPSDAPIPAGIHFLVEGDAVESIFIQGDVERVIFSVEDEYQKIRFIKNTTAYELLYKPKENYFSSWDYSIAKETCFKEKIIINGSVWSIEQEGEGAFTPLTGIRLLVTGTSVIRSNLETAASQFSLQEKKVSNLTLSCSKEHVEQLCDPASTDPGIVVDVDKTAETELQVAMIVDGKFTNQGSELKLSGSLYCTDLENQGTIEIHQEEDSTAVEDNYSGTVDFKFIEQFIIHFIEEEI